MVVIDAAVNHLDDLGSLEDFLLNLGKKHQAIGVKTQSFAVSIGVVQTWLYLLTNPLDEARWVSVVHKWSCSLKYITAVAVVDVKKNSVSPHVFVGQVVGEALLYMLQCSLGTGYTAALRQAWLNMYTIVVSAMTRGWAKNGEHKSN